MAPLAGDAARSASSSGRSPFQDIDNKRLQASPDASRSSNKPAPSQPPAANSDDLCSKLQYTVRVQARELKEVTARLATVTKRATQPSEDALDLNAAIAKLEESKRALSKLRQENHDLHQSADAKVRGMQQEHRKAKAKLEQHLATAQATNDKLQEQMASLVDELQRVTIPLSTLKDAALYTSPAPYSSVSSNTEDSGDEDCAWQDAKDEPGDSFIVAEPEEDQECVVVSAQAVSQAIHFDKERKLLLGRFKEMATQAKAIATAHASFLARHHKVTLENEQLREAILHCGIRLEGFQKLKSESADSVTEQRSLWEANFVALQAQLITCQQQEATVQAELQEAQEAVVVLYLQVRKLQGKEVTFDEALQQAKAVVSLQRAHPEEALSSRSTMSRICSKAAHREIPGSEATTAPQHVAKDSKGALLYESEGEAASPSCNKENVGTSEGSIGGAIYTLGPDGWDKPSRQMSHSGSMGAGGGRMVTPLGHHLKQIEHRLNIPFKNLRCSPGVPGKKLALSPVRHSRPSTAGSELSVPSSVSSLTPHNVSGAAAYQDLSHVSATPEADWDRTMPAPQTCASIRCHPRMPIFAPEGVSALQSGSPSPETPKSAAERWPSNLQSCASTARCPREPASATERNDDVAALGILSALSPVVSFATSVDQSNGQSPEDAATVRETLGGSDASAAATEDALDAWSPVQERRKPLSHPVEDVQTGSIVALIGGGNAGAGKLPQEWVAQLARQLERALQQVEDLEMARRRAARREDKLAKQVCCLESHVAEVDAAWEAQQAGTAALQAEIAALQLDLQEANEERQAALRHCRALLHRCRMLEPACSSGGPAGVAVMLEVEPEEHVSVRLVIRERPLQQGSECALLTETELTGGSMLAAVASFGNLEHKATIQEAAAAREQCESLQAQCKTLSAELRRTRWDARRLQADKTSAETLLAAALQQRDDLGGRAEHPAATDLLDTAREDASESETAKSQQAHGLVREAELRRSLQSTQSRLEAAETTAAAALAERDCALARVANASAARPSGENASVAITQSTSDSDCEAVAVGVEARTVVNELAQLDAEYQRLEADLQRASEELEEAHAKSGHLEAQLSELCQETQHLAKASAELDQSKSDLKDALAAAEVWKQRHAAAAAIGAELQARLQSVQSQLSRMRRRGKGPPESTAHDSAADAESDLGPALQAERARSQALEAACRKAEEDLLTKEGLINQLLRHMAGIDSDSDQGSSLASTPVRPALPRAVQLLRTPPAVLKTPALARDIPGRPPSAPHRLADVHAATAPCTQAAPDQRQGHATGAKSSAAPVSPITPKTSKQQAENQVTEAKVGQAQSVPGTAERRLVARLGERLGDGQGELDRKGTFLRAIDRLEMLQAENSRLWSILEDRAAAEDEKGAQQCEADELAEVRSELGMLQEQLKALRVEHRHLSGSYGTAQATIQQLQDAKVVLKAMCKLALTVTTDQISGGREAGAVAVATTPLMDAQQTTLRTLGLAAAWTSLQALAVRSRSH